MLKGASMLERRFLIKDQTGRGFAVTLPLSVVLERWDGAYSNDPDDPNEQSLEEWLNLSEIGETFTNLDENVTFIRTE
jgi:hypothetical protein